MKRKVLIFVSVLFLPVLVCFPCVLPSPRSLATHALRGEMRHAGNLQADNGRQLLSLHKSFMSWISCTSLCSLPPTNASLIVSWSRHCTTHLVESLGARRGRKRQSMTEALSDRSVIVLFFLNGGPVENLNIYFQGLFDYDVLKQKVKSSFDEIKINYNQCSVVLASQM